MRGLSSPTAAATTTTTVVVSLHCTPSCCCATLLKSKKNCRSKSGALYYMFGTRSSATTLMRGIYVPYIHGMKLLKPSNQRSLRRYTAAATVIAAATLLPASWQLAPCCQPITAAVCNHMADQYSATAFYGMVSAPGLLHLLTTLSTAGLSCSRKTAASGRIGAFLPAAVTAAAAASTAGTWYR